MLDEPASRSRPYAELIRILGEYKDTKQDWSEIDTLAIERGLQILIESVIGLSRYVLSTCFGINVSRSREAIDELKRLGELTSEEREKLNKIIGFRNILVHDYLNVNENITQAIITKQDYTFIVQVAEKQIHLLDKKG
ncbi:MAG: DUF86 domain-containing protein [Desulfoplanes sp.]|nr:DUF86 domain-containing protein [Desulfoplanes sp.]